MSHPSSLNVIMADVVVRQQKWKLDGFTLNRARKLSILSGSCEHTKSTQTSGEGSALIQINET
jgi:hypothetical protein